MATESILPWSVILQDTRYSSFRLRPSLAMISTHLQKQTENRVGLKCYLGFHGKCHLWLSSLYLSIARCKAWTPRNEDFFTFIYIYIRWRIKSDIEMWFYWCFYSQIVVEVICYLQCSPVFFCICQQESEIHSLNFTLFQLFFNEIIKYRDAMLTISIMHWRLLNKLLKIELNW